VGDQRVLYVAVGHGRVLALGRRTELAQRVLLRLGVEHSQVGQVKDDVDHRARAQVLGGERGDHVEAGLL
jgi:hypothetical protein